MNKINLISITIKTLTVILRNHNNENEAKFFDYTIYNYIASRMDNRLNLIKMKKTAFWDGFFFVFGFTSNPILQKAKDIVKKDADQRISESWEITSNNFREKFENEAC